ncbi:MAG: hypothetical protein HY268_00710 [Deltaproteobacteria bacterium]|nr:hypothetical protein [Deltaproteobacteria bacterium]
MAEIEFAALPKQCLARRIPEVEMIRYQLVLLYQHQHYHPVGMGIKALLQVG